jgi:hypothetical protein
MDKINQLKNKLFFQIPGRYDTYAKQKSDGSYERIKKPLIPDIYYNESDTIGAYQLSQSNKVKYFCIDIDVNKNAYLEKSIEEFKPVLQEQVAKTREILDEFCLNYDIEFSGFKGYHIWMFFDEEIDAKFVRNQLNVLTSRFPLVSNDLHLEFFPKQDSITDGGYGNFVKLPLQKHQKSKNYSYFVDPNFGEIIPEELSLNSMDMLKQLPVITKISEAVEPKHHSTYMPPHNMELMFKKCRVLSEIESTSESNFFEGTPGHEKRLFLASVLKPFGNRGIKKVHKILSRAADYDKNKTDMHISSLSKPPHKCETMCDKKLCANICMASGNSPIKFAYQDNIVPFLEKQTSSFAYWDWNEHQLYFVDSEKKLDIILEDAGIKKGKLSVYRVIFDPSENLTIDKDRKTINLFRPTDYMVLQSSGRVINITVLAPKIMLLLGNLIPDIPERERFINWLAGIMQNREKQLTAWVLIGEQGAGKNVLLDHILKPLFGKKQAIKVEDDELKGTFNAWLQNTLIVAFNEVAHDNRTRNAINSKVKAIITDEDIRINEKNVKAYTIDNHVNALFFSNNEIPVLIEKEDRRFNVVKTNGNLRKNSWFANPEQFFKELEKEIPVFAEYLINYNYDANLAKTTFSNATKTALVDAGMSRFEDFAHRLKTKDLEWFAENASSFYKLDSLNNRTILKDEALLLFKDFFGDDKMTKTKLTKELKLYGIETGKEGQNRVYKWD